MTIQSIPYQSFSGMDYASIESLGGIPPSPSSYESRPRYVPTQVNVEGVNVDTVRVIDLLLGQLEQLSYQLARTEAQTEPPIAEANVEAEISVSTNEDYQARFDAFVGMYAQVRADVESAGVVDEPYVPSPEPFAGMLFEIAA
ncbi:MAG: hypothetical protein FWB78_02470 [Treponema sp.]|nr:hypothetical protein [Treponema sp.]